MRHHRANELLQSTTGLVLAIRAYRQKGKVDRSAGRAAQAASQGGDDLMPQDQRGRIEQIQLKLNQKMVRWTAVVAIFTIVLAAVSIVTGAFVYWQSSTAATAASDAREQLRAVIQFAGVQSLSGPSETGEQMYGFSTTLQNLGSTRTGKTTAWQSIAFYSKTVPNNADFSKPRDVVENLVAGIVGGNATIAISPVAVKADDVEKALQKDGFIILWGKATYFDIYSPATERTMSFCQLITPIKDKAGLISFNLTPFRSECNKSI
jgi:hypothetical protein